MWLSLVRVALLGSERLPSYQLAFNKPIGCCDRHGPPVGDQILVEVENEDSDGGNQYDNGDADSRSDEESLGNSDRFGRSLGFFAFVGQGIDKFPF